VKELRKLNIILIFIGAIVGGTALGFVITGFATSGSIDESFTFYHASGSPSPIEQVSLSADIGNIDVRYNTTSTPYLAKIEARIKIAGLFMAGKTYTNFFTPNTTWFQNTTTPTSFDLEAEPGVWFDPSYWFKSYNITIVVTLRTDITYALDVMTTTGNIKVNIPENVTVDDLFLTTTTGNSALYANNATLTKGLSSAITTGNQIINLTNCVIASDISHIGTTGNVNVNLYNLEYSIDVVVDLETTTGNINFNIYQYKAMGANVTGYITATTGNINIAYVDTIASVGAGFNGAATTGNVNYINSGGFTESGINDFESTDYSSTFNTYTFDVETTTGNINVDGQSSLVI